MLYNIGYTNTAVIYHHSTVITNVMLLYNTEWQYDHRMAVNYHGTKFYFIGPGLQVEDEMEADSKLSPAVKTILAFPHQLQFSRPGINSINLFKAIRYTFS